MPKPPRPALDLAAYVALRVVVTVVQAAPTGVAVAAADALAWAVHRVDKRHRAVARENLRHAFPDRSDAAIDRLVRDCYRHFALLIVEIALLPRKLSAGNWRRRASLVNGGPTIRALLDRRPALVVTAHFGNWELAGFVMGALGFRTYAIARVLDNPRIEAFLLKFRQATGQTIIAKKDDFGRLTAALKAGAKVATLADQDAGPRGVFVDFFGRKASAHKAVALMALEFDAVLVVVGVPRTGRFLEYAIECADSIDPRDYAGRADAVAAITQRYHAALEALIRRHPAQYFWLHRRWKTRPRGEANRARQ